MSRLLAPTKVLVVSVRVVAMLCESTGRAADFLAVRAWPAWHGEWGGK